MSALRSVTLGVFALALVALVGSGIGSADTVSRTVEPAPNNTTVPDDGPAYGINNSTFQRLWSGDTDQPDLSSGAFDSWNTSRPEFFRRLAMTTDVPFDRPPAAVEAWNSGDLRDFNPGNHSRSIHPDGVRLRNSEFIRDAYLAVYAVQPSTIVHQSNGTTHYIAPDGEVLTTADFRVQTPDGDPIGPIRRSWDISEARIQTVALAAQNKTQDTSSGHTTTLEYTDLSGNRTLTVRAEIVVEVEEVIRSCNNFNGSTRECNEEWNVTINEHTDSVNVTANRTAQVNDLSTATIERVAFRDGSERDGAILQPNSTWGRIIVDDADGVGVRSGYLYYTAGNENWHNLTTSAAIWNETHESSVRPLQVHAFPRPSGTSILHGSADWSWKPLRVQHREATEAAAPTIPPNFHVDSGAPYSETNRLVVTSTEYDTGTFQQATVYGVVRSQSRTVSSSSVKTVQETMVTVDIVAPEAAGTTLRIWVGETDGTPVQHGRVHVGSRTVRTNDDGIAFVTIQNPPSLVEVTYDPLPWWSTDRPHTPSREIKQMPLDLPSMTDILNLAIVTLLWFIPVAVLLFGVDYASDGALLGIRETESHE
ncbi:hypothetical protein [Haloarchaeobius sp. FL176]|uniref:hypothetical protein n=1 Tax=Haloarchaeobius sp. FL176 TaxID=2967129 RepID=UPI002147E40D|nr:hypothetical protein [Haloarchaeobius sp. FL176]